MSKFYYIFASGLVLLSLAACSRKVEPQEPEDLTGEIVKTIEFSLPDIPYEPGDVDTRIQLIRNGSSMTFAFQATDTLGICPSEGSPIYFKSSVSEGTTASFDGGAWLLKSDATYYSYFPFVGNMYLDKTRVPVDFSGQSQQGNGTTVVQAVPFFACTGEYNSVSKKVSFPLIMVNCYININATLPAGTYTKMHLKIEDPLFVKHGTVDITQASPAITAVEYSDLLTLDLNNVTLASEGLLAAYVASAPMDLSGKVLKIYFLTDEGFVYKAEKTPSKAWSGGVRYGLSCTPALDDGYSFGISSWTPDASYSGTAE